MKKMLIMLLTLFLLVTAVCAEEDVLPDGYRVEDFGAFTLPIAPNALVTRDDEVVGMPRYVQAEIMYLDMSSEHFMPWMQMWWYDQNMSAYLSRVHPLDYAKSLTQNDVASMQAEGMVVTDVQTIYGQSRNGTFTLMYRCRVEENSFLADEPHDLWVAQRFYGTYDMGTYYFDLFAESRAQLDMLLAELDRIEYKE